MRAFRSLSTVAALALALTAALTTAPAGAADPTGLTINIVDHLGVAELGSVVLVAPTGGPGAQLTGSTVTFDNVPPGAYGVFAITPWGGFLCAGLTPCDYFSLVGGTAVPDGSIVVTAGALTSKTIATTPAAQLAGSGQIGSPLSVGYSAPVQAMYDALLGFGADAVPSVQWERDGLPIDGATDDTYTPVGADAGKLIAATLTYTGIGAISLQALTGALLEPFTTPQLEVSKIPTKAFLQVVPSTIPAGGHGSVSLDATANGTVVLGKATVQIGAWKTTQLLRNGSMTVQTPKLRPGRYVVTATYLGNDAFAPAKAKKRTLIVTKG